MRNLFKFIYDILDQSIIWLRLVEAGNQDIGRIRYLGVFKSVVINHLVPRVDLSGHRAADIAVFPSTDEMGLNM